MSNRSLALAGLVLVVVLFGGAVLLLDRLEGEDHGPPARQEQVATAPSTPPPLATPEPGAPGSGLVPPGSESPPPAAAPPVPAAAAAPAGPRKVDLLTSLGRARARILECAGAPAGQQHPALMLDLEAGDGVMTVRGLAASPPVEGADALMECARRELEGRPLEAASAKPGGRLKMRFSLDPRGR